MTSDTIIKTNYFLNFFTQIWKLICRQRDTDRKTEGHRQTERQKDRYIEETDR